MAELVCVICSFEMLTQEAPTDMCAPDAEHDAHSVLYLKIQPFWSNALRITDSLDLSNSCSQSHIRPRLQAEDDPMPFSLRKLQCRKQHVPALSPKQKQSQHWGSPNNPSQGSSARCQGSTNTHSCRRGLDLHGPTETLRQQLPLSSGWGNTAGVTEL